MDKNLKSKKVEKVVLAEKIERNMPK